MIEGFFGGSSVGTISAIFTSSFITLNSASLGNLVLGSAGSVVSAVPIPAAAFLFAPALLGFMGLRRKAKNTVA